MLPKWAWSGSREQFLHCGLRKFRHSKSSVYRWYIQFDRRRYVYDTWDNGSRLGRVMVECTLFMTHCLWLNLQLHAISLVRTCRISSFCTVAWQLARLLLTSRIARSLGDSWASCYIWLCHWPDLLCLTVFFLHLAMLLLIILRVFDIDSPTTFSQSVGWRCFTGNCWVIGTACTVCTAGLCNRTVFVSLSVCPGIQLHVAGECRQCHVCGIWRKLNTRLVDSPSVPLLYSVDPGIIIMVLQLFRLSRLPL